MDDVEVSTDVYVPPDEAYEFLVDFPGYANYSEYLDEVRADGDGSPGTRYALRFSWWKLGYTARTEVVDVDPPSRIDWAVVKDLDARGHWRVAEAPERAPSDAGTASEVALRISFDPDSASSDSVDLPRFVSLSWVVDRVKPLIQEEAERIVERVVADLEGEPRPVELRIDETPESV